MLDFYLNFPLFVIGFTNTSGALWLGRETLDNPVFGNRPDVPDVVLLITDGKDNLDRINFKANVSLNGFVVLMITMHIIY